MSTPAMIGLGRLIVAGTGGAILSYQGAFGVQDQRTFLQVVDKLLLPCLLFSELGLYVGTTSSLSLFFFLPLSALFLLALRELITYLFSRLTHIHSPLSRRLVLTMSACTSTSMIPLVLVRPFISRSDTEDIMADELGRAFCYILMFHAYYDSIVFFLRRWYFPRERTEEEDNMSLPRRLRMMLGMTLSARMMAIVGGLLVGLNPGLHELVFPKGVSTIIGYCTSSLGISTVPALAVLTGGTLFWCAKTAFSCFSWKGGDQENDCEIEKSEFDEFHQEAVTVFAVNFFFVPGIILSIFSFIQYAGWVTVLDPLMFAIMIESLAPSTCEMYLIANEINVKEIQRRAKLHLVAQYLFFVPTSFLWLSLYRSVS